MAAMGWAARLERNMGFNRKHILYDTSNSVSSMYLQYSDTVRYWMHLVYTVESCNLQYSLHSLCFAGLSG